MLPDGYPIHRGAAEERPDHIGAALGLDDGFGYSRTVRHAGPGQQLGKFGIQVDLRCHPPLPQCLLDGREIVGLGRLRHELGHLLSKQPPVALRQDVHPRPLAFDVVVCANMAVVIGARALVTAHGGSIVLPRESDLSGPGIFLFGLAVVAVLGARGGSGSPSRIC